MFYVNVAVANKSRFTDVLFTYGSETPLRAGQIVTVPFGKGNRPTRAFVVETDVTPDDGMTYKAVEAVDDTVGLTEEMTDTALWMRRRYGISYLDALKCFIPSGKPPKEGKEKEPYKGSEGEAQEIESLTEEQKSVIARIDQAIESEKHEIFLLHGVTGSGKTEVYMQEAAKVTARGRTVIMLVPEIALTKQIVERFIARFGKSAVAVLHSKLTQRERFDEWTRLSRGEAKIAIGARIGVFAPLSDIGLIIMDEEHEATYKSDQTPKYEALDVAVKRCMYYGAPLILGSATPSVVSYQRAKEGIYTLLEMKKRYNETLLPEVELVDMKEELRAGNTGIYSGRLFSEMKRNLADGRQVMLFLNRRGYSTCILCEECGEPLKCPDCGIGLVYHKKSNAAVCHYCGRKFPVPDTCPKCGAGRMRFLGRGTEQVEEITAKLFPGKTVARLDLDTAKNGREINRIITSFSKGKTDILVGTQLIAKGMDFRNVGLVGVVFADISLNIPDYRSAERTFQLVTQVAGRAGRGEERGKVIVQSYSPDNFALRAAAAHDYGAFFSEEIKIRRFMDYPPFTDMIVCDFTAGTESLAESAADAAKDYLEKEFDVFPPRVSQNFKGKDAFRYNILIKCPKGQRNKCVWMLKSYEKLLVKNKTDCIMTIDVNPYSSF